MRVLIVDDEESIRITLAEFIKEDGYVIDIAEDAAEALALMDKHAFDVVVTDIVLPRMNGVALMKKIRERSPDTQVIMLTGDPTIETAAEAVRAGAVDYLTKPVSKNAILRVVANAAHVKTLTDEKRKLEESNRWYQHHLEELVEKRTVALTASEKRYRVLFTSIADPIFIFDKETSRFLGCNQAVLDRYGYTMDELLPITPQRLHPSEEVKRVAANIANEKDLSTHRYTHITKSGEQFPVEIHTAELEYQGREAWISIVRDISQQVQAEEMLRNHYVNLAETMARTFNLRNPYVAAHQLGTARLVQLVGERLGLEESRLQNLYIGTLLHDVGKVAVPGVILRKPGKLSEEEWALVRTHPQLGYELLNEANLPWPVAELAHHHHERLDGSGYPDGLTGDQLCEEVRILAVCNVADAMSRLNPHRPARSKEEIVDELKRGQGGEYDTKVVSILLEIIESGELIG